MLESLMPLQVTLPNEAVEKSSEDLALERCLHQAYFKDLRDGFPVLALHMSHIPVAPISPIPTSDRIPAGSFPARKYQVIKAQFVKIITKFASPNRFAAATPMIR
jgi:hypothetical protein